MSVQFRRAKKGPKEPMDIEMVVERPARTGPFKAVMRRIHNRKLTPFRDIADRFSDSASGDTLPGDAVIGLKQSVGITPMSKHKEDYTHRITARANVLQAVSRQFDAVDAETDVEKLIILRDALKKIESAQEHGWLTLTPIRKRREYYVATKPIKETIENRIQQLTRSLATEAIDSSTAPLTPDKLKGMEDFMDNVDSPEARSFFSEKVLEKRWSNIAYIWRATGTTLMAGGVFLASAFSPRDLAETLHGIAGALGVVALAQVRKIRSEAVKRRAAEEGREYNFGIPKNDLQARQQEYVKLHNHIIARSTGGLDITDGDVLEILRAFRDIGPREKRHYNKVMRHISAIVEQSQGN